MAKRSIPLHETAIGVAEGEFLRHNIFSDKKDHGAGTNQRWWRGGVSYYGDNAVMRYMGRTRSYSRKHMFIHLKGNGPYLWWLEKFCDDAEFLQVPELGVFSKYPNDMLGVEGTHDRVKLIMLHRIREFSLEEVPAMSGMALTFFYRNFNKGVYGKSTPIRPAKDGGQYVTAKEMLDDRYSRMADEWESYSDAFRLDWGPVPQMYEDSYRDVVKRKLAAFQDPKSVAKRERIHAKKLAEKALGLPTRN